MRSVRLRLILFFNVLFFLFAIILTGFILKIVEDYYSESITDHLENEAILLSGLTPNMINDVNENELQQFVDASSQAIEARITVISPDGKVLADSLEDKDVMENHASHRKLLRLLRRK